MPQRVMMAVLVIGLLLSGRTLASTTAPADVLKTTPEAIQAEAQQCATAFQAGDFATVGRYTHPKLLEKLGGKDKFVGLVQKGMADMKARGVTFESYIVAVPAEVLGTGNDLFAIVPSTLVMNTPRGSMTQEGYLLGVTGDGGRTWTFIDGAGLSPTALKELIPDPPAGLKLPARKQPTFTK